ncbi:GT-D fold domain-containing glycosyltransferase [Flavobacterium sp.]|uniref:GT-D fold domain-containing glycosyltransferase n=4 Tax=Flavobacterium sp. TaxID=239 RepID=UPI0040484357
MVSSKFVRYGKPFHYIRQLVKNSLSLLYPIFKMAFKMPKVESVFETLEQLSTNNKLSIVRFGDGEILYINDKLNLPFQKYEEQLADCFKEIFSNKHNNLLVGLPVGYHDLSLMSKEGQIFWRSQIVWNYPRLKKYLNLETNYANASVTRLTYGFENEYTSKGFEYWKKILIGNNALIIEGEKTRFGVGNDLLNNFNTIQRIIAPKHDAFDKCDEILLYVKNTININQTILIALGPAAKYLSFKLFKEGYRVIDIGNLDIEYEWYIRGASKERILIPGKYTSEVKGGREIGDYPNQNAFEKYKSEIIAKFL